MASGGWYGTKDEWARLESPLIEVDPILSEFAKEFGLEMRKNFKDWPERSFEWGVSIRRLIQLYLADEKLLTFNLWLCASQDRGTKRYWKQVSTVKGLPISEFKDSLATLLRDARKTLESWSETDLELATNL